MRASFFDAPRPLMEESSSRGSSFPSTKADLFLYTRSSGASTEESLLGYFSKTASRSWSTTGMAREERKTEEAEVSLYGFPVVESKSRNQTREGGDDMDAKIILISATSESSAVAMIILISATSESSAA